MQLELLKPDYIQANEHNIHSTVVIFGSSCYPEPPLLLKN